MTRLYLTTLLLITVIGCTNKKTSYRLDTIQNQELRDFFNLKNGSYWVYKDSVLQTLDTFYLINSGITIEGPQDLGTDDIQELERGHATLKSNDSNIIYYDVYPSGEGQEVLITSYRGDSLIFDQFMTVAFPFNEGELRHYWLQIKKYDSLLLNSKKYYSVFEMKNTNFQDTIPASVHSFSNLENGLLKFTIHNTNKENTFELISSNVIR